ncbi:MAG: S8 family serine peptidase [Chlorobaculum sp.]|nr:S8 family serine peptidase [Chlorobaculum sp.]
MFTIMKKVVVSVGTMSFDDFNGSEHGSAGFFDFSSEHGAAFHEFIQPGINHQAEVQDIMAAGLLGAFSATGGKASPVSAEASTAKTTTVTVKADTSAPTVASFNPVDGGARADVASNITITFSESVQAGSGTIEIHSGSANGALVESFDAATSTHLAFSGSKLTIDPTVNLDYGKDYYVTIASGAVKDLAGNSYAGTTSYDFMTKVAGSTWSSVSGHGLLNVDSMLEVATGTSISDAPLYGGGYNAWDWGVNKVQAPDAWQAGYTGDGIIVAVIDTGVSYTHSDLAGNIWTNTAEIVGNGIDDDLNGYVDDIYGYDFVNRDGYALDDNGHGTHVAGIIAGLRNGVGVTGVAYDATIMSVKVLGSTGTGSFTNVAAGIMYAVNNGADVINLSLGAWGTTSSVVTNAITYAISHGVIVCMASGNDSKPTPAYPAILAETVGGIAVGAVNSSTVVASFSDGAGLATPYDYVEAPGVSIYSTYLNGGYASMSGTSMATPYVAGVAALLLSAQPNFASNWSTEQLESIITSTATSMGGTALTAAATTTTTTLAAASVSETLPEIDLSHLGIVDSSAAVHQVELTGVVSSAEMFIV